MRFVIPDSVYPYLKVQAGYIPETRLRSQWEALYCAKIEMQYENIRPHLPAMCETIIDVGGGMSGIGLRLLEHFPGATVYVVDGQGPPKSEFHDQPFSDPDALYEFYEANGQKDKAIWVDHRCSILSHDKADLITSFHAWCFHIPPEMYLQRVLEQRAGTVILDVRTGKPDWMTQLDKAFGSRGEAILCMPKHNRMVWK